MQQGNRAISATPQPAGNDLPHPVADGAFVINLTASTTPVALTQPSHPELRRFTFFVSRRREDGRERFRLHMGYFRSQEDAERLLELVREIYPAAWAGIAPGQRLRKDNAPPPVIEPAAPAAPVAPAASVASAPAAAVAPALATPIAAVPPPVMQPRVAAPAPPVAAPAPVRTTVAPAPKVAPAAARSVPPPPPAEPPVDHAVTNSLSSVRAAIASLEAPATTPTLSDSQVLKALEMPVRKSPAAKAVAAAPPRSELTNFAVQLMWSVKPIDMAQVPQLAIFSAYTLYGAEGNRDGRRWYGLRLGFFTDAVSAKQVAQYVRSEFTSVSVVPVTLRERERAMVAATQVAPRPEQVASAPSNSGQFKLIDDKAAAETGIHKVVPVQPTGNGSAPKASGKRVRQAPSVARKPTAAKARKSPMTLEETLEILGASQLQIDDNREALINDSGVRHLRLETPAKPRGSKLGRLINRLAERLSDD